MTVSMRRFEEWPTPYRMVCVTTPCSPVLWEKRHDFFTVQQCNVLVHNIKLNSVSTRSEAV